MLARYFARALRRASYFSALVLWIAALLLAADAIGAPITYDFAGLGAPSGGFKPQGNRFLVSQTFIQDPDYPARMYYNLGAASAPGIVIKADGTNLRSFDFKDFSFGTWKDLGHSERIASLTITGTRTTGSVPPTVAVTVTNKVMDIGTHPPGNIYSLTGWGVDLSAFTNITQLTFDLTVDGEAWNVYWTNITIDNEVSYVAGTTPTTQASNLEVSTIGSNLAGLNWTNGNGSNRIVFAKLGTSGTPTITDGTTYTPNSDFPSAADIGGGWKCVYKGPNNGAFASGLTPNTAYRFVVYEMDGTGGGERYLTSAIEGENILNQSSIGPFVNWSTGDVRTLNPENFWTLNDGDRDNVGNGNSYVAHRFSGTSGSTEVQKWNGVGWSTLTSFTPATGGYNGFTAMPLSIDVTAEDRLHIAGAGWHGADPINNNRGVFYAYFNGTSWSFSDIEFHTDALGRQNCNDPKIAIDGAGNPHVLYTFTNSNAPSAQYLKVASRSGGVWTVETLVTIGSYNSTNEVRDEDYVLLTDASNKMHVFYFQQTGATTRSLHYQTNASGSWIDNVLINDSEEEPIWLGGLIDAAGAIHLTFSFGASRGVRYLTNVSGSWVAKDLLPYGTSYAALGLVKNADGDMAIPLYASSQFRVLVKNAGSGLWRYSEASSAMPSYEGSYTSTTFSNDDKVMFVYAKALADRPRMLLYTLANLNSAPTLVNNTGLTVNQTAGQTTITSAMLNVADPDQGPAALTFAVGTAPTKGTLRLSGSAFGAGGTFTQDDINNNRLTYTPSGTQNGADSFTFTVSDGAGGTIGSTTFSITINDDVPPTAVVSYSPSGPYTKGTVVTITANFSEPMLDSPAPQIAISAITGGSALVPTSMNKVSTTQYTFVYTVGNGNGTANVTLSTGTDAGGNPITSTPTSGGGFAVVRSNSTTGLATSGSPSTAGSAVTFTATVTPGATGTVEFQDGGTAITGCQTVAVVGTTATCVTSSLSDGSHSITAGYSGDSTYLPSASSAITQVVANTPPAFVGATTTLIVNRDSGAIDIRDLLHVSDTDIGQTETWSQSASPDHGGALVFSGATASSGSADITPGGTITYQPAAGYSGPETFTVQVSDGAASATRTITITVNLPPAFVGSTTTLLVNRDSGPTDIRDLLHVSDTDSGQTETWSQSVAPDHGGTLVFSGATASSGSADIAPGGTISYQPAPGYSGAESFTVEVSDTVGAATRTITISVNSPPAFTGSPSITGTPAVGSTLALANTGTNDADGDPVTIDYEWRADGTPISGATAATCVLTGAELHKTVTCALTARDGRGGAASATTPGLYINQSPAFTGTPSITGPAVVGATLSLSGTGTDDPDGDSVTVSYQWRVDGVAVAGATSDTYVVIFADASKTLTCDLTASDGFGGTATASTPGVLIEGACVGNIPSGLISMWPANGNPEDIAGANHGTLLGASFAEGRVGQAFEFDGAGSYLAVADAPSLRVSSFTWAAWFNWHDTGTDEIGFLVGKGLERFEVHTGGGSGANGIRFIPAGYPTTHVDAPNFIQPGWNHIAVSYNGTEALVYRNGTLVQSRSGIAGGADLTADASAFQMGRRVDGTYPFDGRIDEAVLFDRVLTGDEIASLYRSGSPGSCYCAARPDGLVSWWMADSDATDSVGANDGSAVGGVSFTAGKVSDAFELDGVSAYIGVPDDAPLRAARFTLAAWMQWDDVGTDNSSFLFGKGSGHLEVQTGSAAGVNGIRFVPAGAGTSAVDAPGVIQAGWNHIAVTFSGDQAHIYRNGALVASRTGITGADDLTTDSSPFLIGATTGGSAPFDGRIDDALFFDRALTGDEIAAIYEAQEGSLCLNPVVSNIQPTGLIGTASATISASLRVVGSINNVTVELDGVPLGGCTVGASSVSCPVSGLSEGSHTIDVTLTDGAGDIATGAGTFSVDTLAATAAISYAPAGPYTKGAVVVITADFSEPLADLPAPQIAISAITGGPALPTTTMTKVTATQYTFIYTVGSGNGTANVTLGTGQDLAGNPIATTPASGGSFDVVRSTSTTLLASSGSPSALGSSVTFTATVTSSATGSVAFYDGATLIAGCDSASVSGDEAACSTSFTNAGLHSIAAVYSGDDTYQGSTAPPIDQNVSQGQVAVQTVTSVNPSVYGQPVTLTVEVVPVLPATLTATGSVSVIFDGGGPVSAPLAGGVATISLPLLAPGIVPISASYGGDSNYQSAGPTNLDQQVDKADTLLAVSSSQNPSNSGEPVSFILTASTVAPGAGIPTGLVSLSVDGGAPVTAPLAGGTVTVPISGLLAGVHTVSAAYLGDDHFNSASGLLPGGQVVSAGASSTILVSTTNPTALGAAAEFVATVSGVAPATGTPNGQVEYRMDGGAPQTVTLVGGSATFATNTLGAGLHVVTANYLGSAEFGPSSGTLSGGQQVNQGQVTVALSTSVSPSRFGQPVSLFADVTPVAPAFLDPTATVTFVVDGVVAGSMPLSGTRATFVTGALGVGSHNLEARYDGDANYTASATTAVILQQIEKSDVTMAVESSQNPSNAGEAVTFNATLTPVAPGQGSPGGTVNFILDGGAPVTVPVVGGIASWTSSPLMAGAHTLTAEYSGDENFNPASGSLEGGQQVDAAPETPIPLMSPGTLALLALLMVGTAVMRLRRERRDSGH